jgi:hypothetical protein
MITGRGKQIRRWLEGSAGYSDAGGDLRLKSEHGEFCILVIAGGSMAVVN